MELELVLGLRLDACQSHLKIESKIWAEQHASVFCYTLEEGIFILSLRLPRPKEDHFNPLSINIFD